MFGEGIYSVSGDIPNDEFGRVSRLSAAFYNLVVKSIETRPQIRPFIRIMKPINALIVLSQTEIHYVFTNKGVGGTPKIAHADFRSKTGLSLQTAIALAERDLVYEDCFGFSLPVSLLGSDQNETMLMPFVVSYFESEIAYQERVARIVRINPIFVARDIMISPKLCFILMPFSNEGNLQEIYTDQIRPTVEKAGYIPRRADDIYELKPIVETIWEAVLSASVIIAELTGKNPNVFYELGIAHTVGKKVILLSQDIDDVPFDLRHLKVILYEPTPRGAETLQKQLSTMLSSK